MENFNVRVLSKENIEAAASGKTILIGEHSVVYGYKALAMAVPDINLSVTIEAVYKDNILICTEDMEVDWLHVWHMVLLNKVIPIEERLKKLLLQSFEKALALVEFPYTLSECIPQKIHIHSQIPLGGGMGGSAAISTCLVRIAAQVAKVKLSLEKQIQFANEVDCLFHNGSASGLDVSAVASDGIIEFKKGSPIKKLENKCHFWLALIDSGERSETAQMVKKVKNYLDENPVFVEGLFHKLDNLASSCSILLEQGNVIKFSECLNEAHDYLVQLGVSTLKMDNIVHELKKHGALAAKLTGAGGGGLVLSVFTKKPEFLFEQYGENNVYVSHV